MRASSIFLVSYRLAADETLDRVAFAATGSHYWRREFMGVDRLLKLREEGAVIQDVLDAAALAGKYWFCCYMSTEGNYWVQDVLTTETAAELVQQGEYPRAISGPHATQRQAAQSVNSWWEHEDF